MRITIFLSSNNITILLYAKYSFALMRTDTYLVDLCYVTLSCLFLILASNNAYSDCHMYHGINDDLVFYYATATLFAVKKPSFNLDCEI